jgi:hypothetical protein
MAAASRSHLRACFIATPSASFEALFGRLLQRNGHTVIITTGRAKLSKLLGNQAYSKRERDYISAISAEQRD